jgi:hypothetical protein
MHAVELREQARVLAEQLGYRVRQEWLGGIAGGGCEIAGQKWIFVDLALSASDQLEQILEALRGDIVRSGRVLSPALLRRLGMRKCA